MGDTPRIKLYRLRKRMSQRELATAVGVSQQHIQRLEAGISMASLDTADKISEALREPLNRVFPAIAKVLKKYPGAKAVTTNEGLKELRKAGVEVEPDLIWTVEFCWSGVRPMQFTLSSGDKDRLNEILHNWEHYFGNSSAVPFFRFDSELYAVCVNLNEIGSSRLMCDKSEIQSTATESAEDIRERAPRMQVWLRGQKQAFEPEVEPDTQTTDSEEDALGQLDFLLDTLTGNMFDHGGFVWFRDEDDEEVFLRPREIALLTIPHWLLNPDIGDDIEEEYTPTELKLATPQTVVVS